MICGQLYESDLLPYFSPSCALALLYFEKPEQHISKGA
jgi:hypothetical protein